MVYYCFTHIKGFQKRSWISMVGAHQKWRFDGSTSSMGEFHQKMGNCFWPWWHNYHCNYHQPDYLKYQTSYIWPIPHSKKNNHEKKTWTVSLWVPRSQEKILHPSTYGFHFSHLHLTHPQLSKHPHGRDMWAMKNTPSSHPVVLVGQYSYVKRTNIIWYQWGF